MKHKVIFSDIDGTLLNDAGELPDTTLNTISRLVDQGIRFATISGRTKHNTNKAISSLKDLCCAKGYTNGTFVETFNKKTLIDSPMHNQDVIVLLEKCKDIEASCCSISVNDAYAKIRHSVCVKPFSLFHENYVEVDSFSNIPTPTYVLAVYASQVQPIIDIVSNQLSNVETSPKAISQSSGLEFIFIQKKGFNKGTALKAIAHHLDVRLSETLAIGDGLWNDGPMIEAAGLGVAMKNASKEIKISSNQVTEKDNNNNGVGTFLKNLYRI
jgi:Cof subfamily protein (haloacid dehalogenase superfamily)